MSGRAQTTKKIENYIERKLNDYPQLLTNYYYSMTNNTAMTKNAYIRYLTEYLDFLKDHRYDITDISTFQGMTLNDLNKFVNHIRYTSVGGELIENKEEIRRAKLAAVRSFYNYLLDCNIVSKNPCDKLKLPKLNHDINVVSMTEEEIHHVKENIKKSNNRWMTRDLLIFTLGCRTGLRVTALCEIDIKDINFNNKTLSVMEKGNKRRDLFLGDNTIALIRDWIKERGEIPQCDALFISDRRSRISQRTVERMILKYTADLDKHITPHKMRATCGTLFYEKTGDVYLVANQLGHKNISNTMRYTNISEKKKKAAAEMLDII
jgi:site-specific recombinase XerD